MGELINTGGRPACSVGIAIDLKDSFGAVLYSGFAFVVGSTLLADSVEQDTCLSPGEVGGFHIFTLIRSADSSSTRIQWDEDKISTPRVTSSQVIIDGPISESTNILGNLSLSGLIKNQSSRHTIESVKLALIGTKDRKVVDIAFADFFGPPCPPTNRCLAPGESRSFQAHMNVSGSEIESYYYKINYKVLN